MHLLTEACFELYWQHLAPRGVLAVHISNRYLDLSRVVRGLAERSGRSAWRVNGAEDSERGTMMSNWVLVTDHPGMAALLAADPDTSWPADAAEALHWTDDFSSLFSVLK